jgi:8-oxo-dGTP pyrophosphatase MutT (NUDIX family)
MKFCSACGASVDHRVPEGDTLPRYICAECETIHYENPKMVVGCIPVWGDQILLCRRAIEPRHGYWTLPAGFLENGESASAGAMRETLEEADARVEMGEMFSFYNLTHINQIYVMFRARLLDLNFGPGTESLEVRLFKEEDIPWDQMAFRTVSETLKHFFADRKRGTFTLHMGDTPPPPASPSLSA